MKTDTEIKDWIDKQKVLTKRELNKFVYGHTAIHTARVDRLWLYVIATKNLYKLKKHKEKRIKEYNTSPNYEIFKKLFKKDMRLRNGSKSAKKILKNVYDIEMPRTSIHSYQLKLKQNANTKKA